MDTKITREEFIAKINAKKVPSYRCKKCKHIQLATILYCQKCSSKDLELIDLNGEGRVVTYTIQNVAPEEYEKYAPYAWAVIELENNVRISGFIEGIKVPSDLPLNSKVRVRGYDERGIILERVK